MLIMLSLRNRVKNKQTAKLYDTRGNEFKKSKIREKKGRNRKAKIGGAAN